mgnify:CR=1 FL=1
MSTVTREQLENALKKYVPAPALMYCVDWITDNQISLRISRSRHSKYGDYRPPQKGRGHRISVNGDLNPYAFLVTFVHEVAHLNQWKQHKAILEPHGKLWKTEYKYLMLPLLRKNIFPPNVVAALEKYMHNPAATRCTNHDLLRALRQHDNGKEKWLTLDDIEIGQSFKIQNGRTFIKKEKLRKNYSCVELKSKTIYLINPMTEVILIEK